MLDAAETVELDRLDDTLRLARALVPELFHKVVANAGTRLLFLRQTGKTDRLDSLIAAGAWTDATFALLELEMPAWTVRRVVLEHGEWFCSLSRQPNLPVVLDDAAEGSHEVLPLAILRALVETRRRRAVAPRAISTVPQVQPAPARLICCDNFS